LQQITLPNITGEAICNVVLWVENKRG